ncbi:MAG: hypothetical protein WC718_09950 [Phycisphaerales bacterium]|jgi:methyl-accepting chemotaxis protein
MRLLGLAFLGPVAALAVAAGGVKGLRLVSAGTESIALNGTVLRNHMQCDMDHDALRADVVDSLAAKDDVGRHQAMDSLKDHVAKFREFLDKNKALVQDPK